MVDYKIISSEVISNSEVADLIEKKIKNLKEDEELSYREDKINEYLKKFNKVSFKVFKELFEEIKSLEIPRLESEHIIKIIDLMPKSGTELRAIVSNSGTVLVDESVTKILDVLKKHS